MQKVVSVLEKINIENCDGERGGSSDGGRFAFFNKVIGMDLPEWLQMSKSLKEVREQVSRYLGKSIQTE